MFKHFSDSTLKKLKIKSMNQSYSSLNKKNMFFRMFRGIQLTGNCPKSLKMPPTVLSLMDALKE